MNQQAIELAPPPPARYERLEPPVRAGGLRIPSKGEMTPVFTVLLTMMLVDVLALLVVPFLSSVGTDSPWGSPARLGFLGASVFSGLVFGLLTSVVAERRNHSPWWFLAGQAGTVAALVIAATGLSETRPLLARLLVFSLAAGGSILAFLVMKANPRSELAPIGPVQRRLGRIYFQAGNIWLGIALLVILIASIVAGGFWETHFGAKSARAMIYASPWFGVLLLVFAVSLISATLRKYPFRVDQTGWITVHTALVVIIVGSFMSFWGKQEGELALREGQSSSVFDLDTETRILVEEPRTLPNGRTVWKVIDEKIATFDVNPARREIEHLDQVEDRGDPLFRILIDRYYADSRQEFVQDNEGPRPRAAVAGEIIPPGAGRTIPFVVAEHSRGSSMEMLRLELRRPPSEEAALALIQGRHQSGTGTLRVVDTSGQVIFETPVRAGARPADARNAPAALDLDVPIPGTELKIKGHAWFDDCQIAGSGASQQPVDASPGRPNNPAVAVMLSGPRGDEPRFAFSWHPDLFDAHAADSLYPDYRIELDYFPVPRQTVLFIPREDGSLSWVFQPSSDLVPRSDRVEPASELDLGIPLRVRVSKTFDRYREEQTWEFVGYTPRLQAIRFHVENEDHDHGARWLVLDQNAEMVHKAGFEYRVRWVRTQRPLGFELKLQDFHRDFYPGSRQERTFESWVWLRHESRQPELVKAYQQALEAAGDPAARDLRPVDPVFVKIDMNHPLRLDGWRLYQSRFGSDGATTFLQVNRDPGLVLIYPACALLTLGFVIVFFQKRPFLFTLKSWLSWKGASSVTAFLASLGVVALAFIACIPGILVGVLLPEGPWKGVAVLVIVAGLVLETLIMDTLLTRRLKAQIVELERAKSAAGASS